MKGNSRSCIDWGEDKPWTTKGELQLFSYLPQETKTSFFVCNQSSNRFTVSSLVNVFTFLEKKRKKKKERKQN